MTFSTQLFLSNPVRGAIMLLLLLVVCILAPPADALVGKASRPVLGFSTWNQFGSDISDELIRSVGDALVSTGLAAKGYNLLAIDDAWAAEQRDSSGRITAHPVKFPHGMKALADYLHSKGLRMGLYTSRATRTCGGQMPGSLGYEMVDAVTFAGMGADWLKNDDCHVTYANAARDYGAMERALAAVKNRSILHNVKAPDLNASAAPHVSQFRRVGKDLKNTWRDMVRVLDTGLDRQFLDAATGNASNFFQDFDMLEVGNTKGGSSLDPGDAPLTINEQIAHFSLWAALKSPLQLGNDPRNMTQETLAILGNDEVLAVNQDPLGVPVRRILVDVAPTMNGTTKVGLAPCADPQKDPQMARLQQWSRGGADDGTIRNGNDGRCLGLWSCRRRWPWWMVASDCSNSTEHKCGGQAWETVQAAAAAAAATNAGAADEADYKLRLVELSGHGWPSSGGVKNTDRLCLHAEGSNAEIDECGWSVDANRDSWQLPAAGDHTTGTIRSALNGLCLTLSDNLEVYAGPLQAPPGTGPRFTVLMFNRSPEAAVMTLPFSELGHDASAAAGTANVRDLLTHTDNGTVTGYVMARVGAHSLVHLNLHFKSVDSAAATAAAATAAKAATAATLSETPSSSRISTFSSSSRSPASQTTTAANWTSFCDQVGWEQVWADDFDGPLLDNSSWSVDFKGNDSRVRDSLGTRDNVYLEDGALVLRTQRQKAGGYDYTSGAVQTQGKRSWRGHTRVCIKAQLPGGAKNGANGTGNGIWPAHWLMPNDSTCWPDNGEIDIMEMIDGDGMLHGTYHWGSECGKQLPSGGQTKLPSDWATAFHEYAVEYSTKGITFAFDGNPYFTVAKDATLYDVPYYIILNTAIGGPWPKPPSPATILPAYHRIDRVSVAQKKK